LDQVQAEGFVDISKVTETADFVARCGDTHWAFQVIHINKYINEIISREVAAMVEDPPRFHNSPMGSLSDIYSTEHGLLRAGSPIASFFWEAIRLKNSKFGRWKDKSFRRCIVIVTIERWFENDFEQQLGAYIIRNAIHDEGLGKIQFEDLIWLPNLGDGLWFTVGDTLAETQCFGTPDTLSQSEYESLLRQNHFRLEVMLNLDNENQIIHFGDQWWRVCEKN
jgi:hypothetical protein